MSRSRNRNRSGMTLVEMAIAAVLLASLSFVMVTGVRLAKQSHGSVVAGVTLSAELRDARSTLADELKLSSPATLAVTTLPDGNSRLVFQNPITVEGNPTWGVRDTSLGSTPAEWNHEGWSLCYTVDTQGGTRRLVRQVLDDQGAVQRETVLMEGLASGTANPPGFSVVSLGEIWELTLGMEAEGNAQGEGIVFHVKPRNSF